MGCRQGQRAEWLKSSLLPTTAQDGKCKCSGNINIQVHAGITHDGQVARRGQPHFAVDLVLAAVGGVTARPDIDVAYSRTGPLLYTLGAKILKPNVLVQIRGEDDFALRELARGRREGQRIVERADTPGCEATTTIIGDCRTRGIIVGESIECMCDCRDDVACLS